ncbi:hypothetical protein LTR66_014820, partial [Elasticomyces elasticus]
MAHQRNNHHLHEHLSLGEHALCEAPRTVETATASPGSLVHGFLGLGSPSAAGKASQVPASLQAALLFSPSNMEIDDVGIGSPMEWRLSTPSDNRRPPAAVRAAGCQPASEGGKYRSAVP